MQNLLLSEMRVEFSEKKKKKRYFFAITKKIKLREKSEIIFSVTECRFPLILKIQLNCHERLLIWKASSPLSSSGEWKVLWRIRPMLVVLSFLKWNFWPSGVQFFNKWPFSSIYYQKKKIKKIGFNFFFKFLVGAVVLQILIDSRKFRMLRNNRKQYITYVQ